jgi:hypothetical protein
LITICGWNMKAIRSGRSSIDTLPFDDVWLLWRTGELGDAEIAQFAFKRPDFGSWLSKRRASLARADVEKGVHLGSNDESLLTRRTSSG